MPRRLRGWHASFGSGCGSGLTGCSRCRCVLSRRGRLPAIAGAAIPIATASIAALFAFRAFRVLITATGVRPVLALAMAAWAPDIDHLRLCGAAASADGPEAAASASGAIAGRPASSTTGTGVCSAGASGADETSGGDAVAAVSVSATGSASVGGATEAAASPLTGFAMFDVTSTGRRSSLKPRAFSTPPSSSGEQPRMDIISGVTVKPPSPVAPLGGWFVPPGCWRQASSGRMRSARRSRMSRRIARGPQTWNP